MLSTNDNAPDFNLAGSDGKQHTLKDYSGKYLVIYFYPRDDTPGCTIEAKGFTKDLDDLKKLGAEIVGVSNDSLEAHGKFCSKYGLRHLLLSDTDSSMIKKYDAYGNKGIFGWGTLRKTFIIGKDGKILKIYEKVHPDGHEKEIAEFLKTLN